MADSKSSVTVRVAVTQAEPEWFDLEKSVQKTCALIEEAANNGAKLIAFPECWIPGYPAWIWTRPIDPSLTLAYTKSSLRLPSPGMTAIRTAASTHSIAVALGFSERTPSDSLYIAQALISPTGALAATRRKIKPTHMERTIFGDAAGGSDTLYNVAALGLGTSSSGGEGEEKEPAAIRVSALSCWEHAQPLLKFHTALRRPAIHVAAWPPLYPHAGADDPTLWSMSAEGCAALSRTFAVEAQAFVLHATAVVTEKGVEANGTSGGMIMNRRGGGDARVFGPDGREWPVKRARRVGEGEGEEGGRLEEGVEGVVYADLEMDAVVGAKGFLDVGGHYSRPDVLWLGVDGGEKRCVVVKGDE